MKLLFALLTMLLLTGCALEPENATPITESPMVPTEAPVQQTLPPPDPIDEMISDMSLEERIGQLFLARCFPETAISDIETYHLGGFVLFASDFQNEVPDTLRSKLSAYQYTARIPLLLAVDEEGGTVTRISRYPAFRSQPFPDARTLFTQQGYDALIYGEEEKCQLLSSLGINVNLGPVCDITTEPGAFMYRRSLGQAPSVTARYVMDTVSVMSQYRIGSTLKHFPGYGNNTDTHTGIARDSRSLEEFSNSDLIPFRSGIESGCDAILVSHTIVECWDVELPASLSPAVHQYLRSEMGFDGVIITDDLVMQAITDLYGAGEAAVMAVLAGNDLLCSTEYQVQYEAVLAAVLEGRIHLRVLNAAVRNVLEWKMELGLL